MKIEDILSDLRGIDINRILENIKKVGIINTARIFGYELSHYDYQVAAGRLLIWDLWNKVPPTILEYAKVMKDNLNKVTHDYIVKHHRKLQSMINKNKHYDFNHDFFSASTLIKMYLAKVSFGSDPVESPSYMAMRVAVQLHHESGIQRVRKMYKEMIKGYYTPASPTLFNAGMIKNQMSSCFLITISDNLPSILYTGIGDIGMIVSTCAGVERVT